MKIDDFLKMAKRSDNDKKILVSLSSLTHKELKEYCQDNGLAMSLVVEIVLKADKLFPFFK